MIKFLSRLNTLLLPQPEDSLVVFMAKEVGVCIIAWAIVVGIGRLF